MERSRSCAPGHTRRYRLPRACFAVSADSSRFLSRAASHLGNKCVERHGTCIKLENVVFERLLGKMSR